MSKGSKKGRLCKGIFFASLKDPSLEQAQRGKGGSLSGIFSQLTLLKDPSPAARGDANTNKK